MYYLQVHVLLNVVIIFKGCLNTLGAFLHMPSSAGGYPASIG